MSEPKKNDSFMMVTRLPKRTDYNENEIAKQVELATQNATSFLENEGVAKSDIVRVEIPSKRKRDQEVFEDSDELDPVSSLSPELSLIIPVLQSDSIFGSKLGLLLIEAQNLKVEEERTVAELLVRANPESVRVAIIWVGEFREGREGQGPTSIKQVANKFGIKPDQVKGASIKRGVVIDHIREQAGTLGLRLDASARNALVQQFGTDIGSIKQALDQLAQAGVKPTAQEILTRFDTRPDQPIWEYTDAILAGKSQEALRRLSNLMIHSHPLAVLGALESQFGNCAHAVESRDFDDFSSRYESKRKMTWQIEKVWKQRKKWKPDSLRRVLGALQRADKILKSAPEDLHQMTMERLTVALCIWYN